jgi:anti-sigma factor RsiW
VSCEVDLKAYAVDELSRGERGIVEDHVRGCQSCREELDRLNLTRSALATLEEEEVPRRIAFVSDRVFEPRWYETIWRSGPAMGFASAALLAAAILVHGFEARPVASAPVASVIATMDQAQIEQRVNAAVAKAVNDAQAKQSAEFAQVLAATERRFETQRQTDLADVQQYTGYLRNQMARIEVASNEENRQ